MFVLKPWPLITMRVPPARLPLLGETEVMDTRWLPALEHAAASTSAARARPPHRTAMNLPDARD